MKTRYFLIGLALIFILHIITYPSIYHIIDEEILLNIGKKICNLDFSEFFGSRDPEAFTHNTPLYQSLLCITSPIHKFNVERAELVTFSFLLAMIAVWYYTVPDEWKVDKKKFVLLLFANSLLWVYSLRVLIDVPLAFLFSLGVFNLFLFFQYRRQKNYYLAFAFLSLSMFTKESAILFIPIFFVYFLIKKVRSIKDWLLLGLPLLPFAVFTFFQYLSGFPIFKEYFDVALKQTTTHTYYSLIPYTKFPAIVFMAGIFGAGIFSLVWMWKSMMKRQEAIKNFLLFSLIFYAVWELFFDFIIFANVPRYHTPIIPFLSLIIAMSYGEGKLLKYIFYITLLYTLLTGFVAGFYFHTQETAIWKSFFDKFG